MRGEPVNFGNEESSSVTDREFDRDCAWYLVNGSSTFFAVLACAVNKRKGNSPAEITLKSCILESWCRCKEERFVR